MKGRLVDSPGRGQEREFRAEWVEVVGESDAEVRREHGSTKRSPTHISEHR